MSPRLFVGLVLVVLAAAGAVLVRRSPGGQPDLAFGKKGIRAGEFSRPRALALDPAGNLFVVDFTARVQMFDRAGRHLGLTFTPPDYRNGRPSGLGTDARGRLMVADSHYHCVRIYDIATDPPAATEVVRLGGQSGPTPGRFGYVSDVVQDADGFFYLSEFGETDRVTKLAADGSFVACWGENGVGPGQFNRVRALALGPDGLLYCVDACNHRVQAFDRGGRFVRTFGEPGTGPGQLSYPYDLTFLPDGTVVVVERGNHRLQRFTAAGEPLGTWGGPAVLADPWAVIADPAGRLFVADTEHHRVVRVKW
jgi:DNA-binding beta-propeller fold protein YncE